VSSDAGREFCRLVEIMERLRGPGGCPWDREQSPESLRRTFLEEAYELLEAIDERSDAHIREELGDLCLHIVFQARMAEERGAFTVADSLRSINEKLVRRHPHVFGEVEVDGAAQVLENWDAIKAEERDARGETRESVLDGAPRGMSALLAAEKLQRLAAKVGFDWPDASGPLDKVAEEAGEIAERAEAGGDVEEELGDLLFSIVNLSRFLGVCPEVALLGACEKFERRFRAVERRARAAGRSLEEMTLEEMDALWDATKEAEREARCDSTSS
jgi:tetrapyrrole methylase family protein / MazG family protein